MPPGAEPGWRHPRRPGTLRERIETEVRERLQEAIDAACLGAFVEARRGRGLEEPRADSEADRAEYEAIVEAFLERLHRAIASDHTGAVEAGVARVTGSPTERLLAAHVALAQALPDYWQQFDRLRSACATAAAVSGRERPGLLGRLLRRA